MKLANLTNAGTAGTTGTISSPWEKFVSPTRVNDQGIDDLGGPESVPVVPAVPAPGPPHAGLRRADRDPLPWFEALLTAVGSARIGKKWQCPVHATSGEHSVSLRLYQGRDDGRLMIFCHAGCDFRDIVRALRLPYDALNTAPPTPPERHARLYLRGLRFPPPRKAGALSERGLRFECEHPYGAPTAIAWKLRYRHPVTGEKEVRWESLNGDGQRVPGLLGRREAELPLYRQRAALMAIGADEPVTLVESESSVDALERAGIYATTWAGGAGSPPLERLADMLGGYPNLVIVPDNDSAGLKCLGRIRTVLPIARVVTGASGEDARDLLRRLGPRQFSHLISKP